MSLNSSRISSSESNLFPTILIFLKEADSPSSISTESLILFFGRSSVDTSTSAEYFPCEEYCLSSSTLKLSKTDLLYKAPSEIPEFFKPSNKASVLICLLPSIKISSIVGLSFMSINKALPSLPNLMSSNFPVSKIDKAISLKLSSFISSPRPIGITAKILPADTL